MCVCIRARVRSYVRGCMGVPCEQCVCIVNGRSKELTSASARLTYNSFNVSQFSKCPCCPSGSVTDNVTVRSDFAT